MRRCWQLPCVMEKWGGGQKKSACDKMCPQGPARAAACTRPSPLPARGRDRVWDGERGEGAAAAGRKGG